MKSPKVRGKVEIPFTLLSEKDVVAMDNHPVEAAQFMVHLGQDVTSLLFRRMAGHPKEIQDLAIKSLVVAMMTQFKALQSELDRAKREQAEDGKEQTFTPEQEEGAKELATEYLGKIMKGGEA